MFEICKNYKWNRCWIIIHVAKDSECVCCCVGAKMIITQKANVLDLMKILSRDFSSWNKFLVTKCLSCGRIGECHTRSQDGSGDLNRDQYIGEGVNVSEINQNFYYYYINWNWIKSVHSFKASRTSNFVDRPMSPTFETKIAF